MDTWVWVVIAAAAVIVILALALWMFTASKRRAGLQERFGDEYDRTVESAPSRREAEAELRERQSRREQLDIKPLDDADRQRFTARWYEAQALFVDDPRRSLDQADALIIAVMETRGYPVGEFDERAADISVDRPRLVEDYRTAHEITNREDRSTEDERQAMLHYRNLFEDLVEETAPVER